MSVRRLALALAALIATGATVIAQSVQERPGADRPFSATRLVQVFRGPRELPRQKVLREIIRFHLDDPGLPPALAEAVGAARGSGRTDASVFAAIRLLEQFEAPAAGERLVALLRDEDPRVAVLAADALGGRRDPTAVGPLAGLAGREEFRRSYAFRHAVVNAVGQLPSPGAVDFLVDLLPETDGQLRYEAARRLTALTGENHGGHADRWRE